MSESTRPPMPAASSEPDPTTPSDSASVPDVRPYLEIRTANPSGFSPDGRRLLIASDLSGTSQVHRLDLDDGPLPRDTTDLVPLTDFDEPIGAGYLPVNPSGDAGNRLLLATDRGGNERYQLFTASDEVQTPLGSADDLDELVVDDEYIHRPGGVTRDGRLLAYATNRDDGVAFDTWVRDLVTGEERRVVSTGGWTNPSGFSPDGRWLAITEITTRPGDNRVLLVDLDQLPDDAVDETHEAVFELAPHPDSPGSVGAPSWLPDSSAFYFATDVGREFVGIARGTPDGSWEYVVEPGWDAGCAVDWAGRHLLVAWNDDGRSRAELRDPRTLEVTAEVPLPGDGVASGFRFSRDGRWLTFGFSSPLVPGDSWRYDTETHASERLTVSPCDVDPGRFVDAELVRFASFDGLEVPAFVYRPRTGTAPFPVVVVIHGGPEAQYRPSFAPLTQYLVDQGFAVVAPNVRGSTGYGRSYQHLDDVHNRRDSIDDLAGLHDWIASQDDLDHERTALYGGSYGGYMTLAGLVFHPERWAAGVSIVGMSNLVTFLENTSTWRRAFREREYGSLEHDRDFLLEVSPITHIENMRAPLFLVHGANDPRVPLSETEAIHGVLAERGITAELLVYEDEGHGLSKLRNRIDAYPKIAAFLHRVLDVPH